MTSTGCARAELSGYCSVCSVRGESLCNHLDACEMREVAATMAHLPVREDETLLAEGTPTENLYVVVSGAFRLVRMMADGRRQITGFAFPGDILGQTDGRELTYSAESLEPGLVCRFPNGYLDRASLRHPEIKDQLIESGQAELHKARDHIVLLGKTSADERVFAFLKMIAGRTGHGLDGEAFYLPMSRQDMADYLGLRMETLSRTLTALRKAGKLSEVTGRLIRFAEAEGAVPASA